ncbi:MAG: alpha/beta fold hydrolase [Motilibacteraceae bacterium]
MQLYESTREHAVATPDGRRLRVREAGDPAGAPVLVHHGMPSVGLVSVRSHEDALARGLRLVAWDRPGYPGSCRLPGRTVDAAARDAVVVADALRAGRFMAYGMSAGGPHALAVAALVPERVVAAAVMASPAPFDAAGLDWSAGRDGASRASLEQAVDDPEGYRGTLEEARGRLLASTPGTLHRELAHQLSPVDAAALSAGFAASVHARQTAALADGVDGWLDDTLALLRPWGFDVAEVRCPVLVVHGSHDQMSPPAHGRWLAAHLPRAEARLGGEHGHVRHTAGDPGPVHAWLRRQWELAEPLPPA